MLVFIPLCWTVYLNDCQGVKFGHSFDHMFTSDTSITKSVCKCVVYVCMRYINCKLGLASYAIDPINVQHDIEVRFRLQTVRHEMLLYPHSCGLELANIACQTLSTLLYTQLHMYGKTAQKAEDLANHALDYISLEFKFCLLHIHVLLCTTWPVPCMSRQSVYVQRWWRHMKCVVSRWRSITCDTDLGSPHK